MDERIDGAIRMELAALLGPASGSHPAVGDIAGGCTGRGGRWGAQDLAPVAAGGERRAGRRTRRASRVAARLGPRGRRSPAARRGHRGPGRRRAPAHRHAAGRAAADGAADRGADRAAVGRAPVDAAHPSLVARAPMRSARRARRERDGRGLRRGGHRMARDDQGVVRWDARGRDVARVRSRRTACPHHDLAAWRPGRTAASGPPGPGGSRRLAPGEERWTAWTRVRRAEGRSTSAGSRWAPTATAWAAVTLRGRQPAAGAPGRLAVGGRSSRPARLPGPVDAAGGTGRIGYLAPWAFRLAVDTRRDGCGPRRSARGARLRLGRDRLDTLGLVGASSAAIPPSPVSRRTGASG